VSQNLRFLNICISKVLCLYFIAMQNSLVEYAEPSILPRIHFNAEDKAKGAVDFLNTTFFDEVSTVAPTKSPDRAVAQIGQVIQDLVPKVVDQLTNLVLPTGGRDGRADLVVRPPTTPSTAPPLVHIQQTSSTSLQPGSPAQVYLFYSKKKFP
jgi:hypothetical protein